MAAILGVVRIFLCAMPFLRAFTDMMVNHVSKSQNHGWDKKLPLGMDLKEQVKMVITLMEEWKGRPFQDKIPVRTLYSDSSDLAWAGVDAKNGTIIQEFWRERGHLHINVKELHAAMDTVRSLAKPGELVTLRVDNSVTYYHLKKQGGKILKMNALVRPFLDWCMKNNVHLDVQLIKSDQCLADGPSRWGYDHNDYSLNRELARFLMKKFAPRIVPEVDMFASPGNALLQKFVSRWPHWQAWGVDALAMPMEGVKDCYANPPWTLIQPWLHRLRATPHVRCLMIIPYWVSSVWWPLLLRLLEPNSPQILIPPFWGMFTNCMGERMPRPRWPLLCVIASGACYRADKHRLRALKVTWQE
jgi:hypothetical protein